MNTRLVGKWVSAVLALLGAISVGGISLPLGIPPDWLPVMKSWSISILGIYAIVNPFLPSDIFGPLRTVSSPAPEGEKK